MPKEDLWNRLPDEPAVWFARFEAYRSIGASRSIEEAYRVVKAVHRLGGARPGQAWYQAADRWRWEVRADAWDDAKRKRLMAKEEAISFDARERRRRIIREQLDTVLDVLATAKLNELTLEEAREMLPSMRVMARDLLRLDRDEHVTVGAGVDEGEVLPFTADELGRASKVLRNGPGAMAMMAVGYSPMVVDNFSIVFANTLARLYPEESSARRVAARAGIDSSHVRFGSAADTWHELVEEAMFVGRVEELVEVVQSEYSQNQELQRALEQRRRHAG